MKTQVTKQARRELDVEALRFWKTTSTTARLNFLDSALKFGKQFGKKDMRKSSN